MSPCVSPRAGRRGAAHACDAPPGTFCDPRSGRSIAPGNARFDHAAHWCRVFRDAASAASAAQAALYHALHRRGGRGGDPPLAAHLRAAAEIPPKLFVPACRGVLRDSRLWGGEYLPESTALLLRSLLAMRAFRRCAAARPGGGAARLSDPLFLPSREELLRPFGLYPSLLGVGDLAAADGSGALPLPEDWWANRDDDIAALVAGQQREAAAAVFTTAGGGEETLWAAVNAAAGSFVCPTPLSHWCELHDWHDCLTREYVAELAGWIRASVPAGGQVVEVGCGRGRLAWHLSRALRGTHPPVRATDSDAFDDPAAPGAVPGVARMGYSAALRELEPALVICAWMPAGDDWTRAFRAAASVQQYLLLGPPGTSATPAAWAGAEAAAEGWRRRRLRRVERHAVCKLDCALDPGNSRAVAFLRGDGCVEAGGWSSEDSESEPGSESEPAWEPAGRGDAAAPPCPAGGVGGALGHCTGTESDDYLPDNEVSATEDPDGNDSDLPWIPEFADDLPDTTADQLAPEVL